MTRYLLAAVTVASALFAAPAPANACELQYCTWSKPVCDLRLFSCDSPILCSNFGICL